MSTKRKLLLSSAGAAAGGAPLDITDVFSTFLYDGTGSAQTITNGIDLSGEGGLVWIKTRTNDVYTGYDGLFFDTERTLGKKLIANSTNAEASLSNGFTAFNSNGFSIGSSVDLNSNGEDIVSWTFRKAENWFDIQTWTGDGTSSRNISHSLNSVPGLILVKRTDASSGWRVFHRSEGATKYAMLQSSNAFASASTIWNNTSPTSTVFTVGSDTDTNGSGGSFVAYLFAHNDGDGEFGPDADQDVIKAGSFTKTDTGGTNFIEVNLGFEVQWLLTKTTSESGNWDIWDVQRGLSYNGAQLLSANSTSAESSYPTVFRPTPNGFEYNDNNAASYIYLAVRRGPLAEPENATDVFAIDDRSGGPPNAVSGFPVDMGLFTNRTSADNKYVGARLIQGKRLYANQNYTEGSSSEVAFDYNTGFIDRSDTSTDNIHFMWRRAPSWFDCVCYRGTGSNRTISHNLGVVPEMIWVKARDWAEDWNVYHSALGNQAYLKLNTTNQVVTSNTNRWNSTSPTASVFSLGTTDGVNKSSYNFIAFLFATVAGISKVGSFSHTNGSATDVDCGFSSGARFVLIKRTDSTSDWRTYNTFRGIVSGNDPYLVLNETDAETSGDFVDPLSSGFTVTDNYDTGSYIFYAIA